MSVSKASPEDKLGSLEYKLNIVQAQCGEQSKLLIQILSKLDQITKNSQSTLSEYQSFCTSLYHQIESFQKENDISLLLRKNKLNDLVSIEPGFGAGGVANVTDEQFDKLLNEVTQEQKGQSNVIDSQDTAAVLIASALEEESKYELEPGAASVTTPGGANSPRENESKNNGNNAADESKEMILQIKEELKTVNRIFDIFFDGISDTVITCDLDHRLFLTTHEELGNEHSGYWGGFKCNECRAIFETKDAMHCSLCKFDLCRQCSLKLIEKKRAQQKNDVIEAKQVEKLAKKLYSQYKSSNDESILAETKDGDDDSDSKIDVDVKCDKGHTLVKTNFAKLASQNNGYSKGFICDSCDSVFKNPTNVEYKKGGPKQQNKHKSVDGSFTCSKCCFDYCPDCYQTKKSSIINQAKEAARNRIENKKDNKEGGKEKKSIKNVFKKNKEKQPQKQQAKKEEKKAKVIVIKCDRQHVLTKMSFAQISKVSPGYVNGYQCENCGQLKKSTVYHCSYGCFFDLCESCHGKAMQEEKEFEYIEENLYLHCDNNHRLESIRPKDLKKLHVGYRNGFGCDSCGKTYRHSRVWHCNECYYDLCRTCYHDKLLLLKRNYNKLKQEGSKMNDNNGAVEFVAKCGRCRNKPALDLCTHQQLIQRSKGYMYGFVCNICRRSYPTQSAYNCRVCQYDLCTSCHNSQRNDFIGKSSKLFTNFTSEEKDDGSSSKGEVTCDKHHKLKKFSKNQLIGSNPAYQAGYQCNECRLTYSSPDLIVYHCPQCYFDLCPKCHDDRLSNIDMLNAEFDSNSGGTQIEGSLSLYDSNDNENMSCPRCQVPNRKVKLTTHAELVQENGGYRYGYACNICRKSFPTESGYHCKYCTWDACPKCFTLKKNGSTLMCGRCGGSSDCILTTPAELVAISSGYRHGFQCNGCAKVVRNENSYNCRKCHFDICQACFDERRSRYLHFAVSMNDLILVKRLVLYNKWDVNQLNKYGQTPLIIAWINDDSHKGDERIVRFLLDNGGHDGNYRDAKHNYSTMLQLEARENKTLLVKSLLTNGSDIKTVDRDNNTAIYYALESGNSQFVKFLCYVLTTKVRNCDEMLKLMNFDALNKKCVEKGYNDMLHFFNVLRSSLKEGRLKMVRNVIADSRRKRDKIFEKYMDLKRQSKENALLLKYLDSGSKDGILNAVFKLLELKLPIDDSILMLCFNHLTARMNRDGSSINNNKHGKGRNEALMRDARDRAFKLDKLVNLLKQTVQSALADTTNETRKRDYLWFQNYLLNSNIWFVKYNDTLLFDEICKVLNGEMIMQQKYLKRCFIEQFMLKSDNEYWTKLISFKDFIVELSGGNARVNKNDGQKKDKSLGSFENEKQNRLRQDRVENGLTADVEKTDLFVSQETGFDGTESYDLNVYLTNLLILSHAVNNEFQAQMKSIFSDKKYGIQRGNFQPAPVKKAARCQIKAQTDYGEREWPRCACILDTVRCSITFQTSRDMIESIEKFQKIVGSGKGGCVKRIVRAKNMFAQYSKKLIDGKKSVDEQTRIVQSMPLSEFRYCDIKFNVVIERNGKAILGEVQFLIRFMLEAKIMGHSLYSVVRRREFVDDVLSAVQEEQKSDPAMLVVRKDYNEFCHQLLINDARILSVGHAGVASNDPPVLYLSLKAGWNKAAKLFYDALVHFDKAHDLKNQFVEKYLSHPMLKEFENHPLLQRQDSMVKE